MVDACLTLSACVSVNATGLSDHNTRLLTGGAAIAFPAANATANNPYLLIMLFIIF
jgi:hypothetical protein